MKFIDLLREIYENILFLESLQKPKKNLWFLSLMNCFVKVFRKFVFSCRPFEMSKFEMCCGSSQTILHNWKMTPFINCTLFLSFHCTNKLKMFQLFSAKNIAILYQKFKFLQTHKIPILPFLMMEIMRNFPIETS